MYERAVGYDDVSEWCFLKLRILYVRRHCVSKRITANAIHDEAHAVPLILYWMGNTHTVLLGTLLVLVDTNITCSATRSPRDIRFPGWKRSRIPDILALSLSTMSLEVSKNIVTGKVGFVRSIPTLPVPGECTSSIRGQIGGIPVPQFLCLGPVATCVLWIYTLPRAVSLWLSLWSSLWSSVGLKKKESFSLVFCRERHDEMEVFLHKKYGTPSLNKVKHDE